MGLGRIFAQHFYYRRLPKHGLIFGFVACLDDRPIGFAVGTTDSGGFMSRGLRAEWRTLAWALPASMLSRPRSVVSLWRTLRLMKERGAYSGNAPCSAELLSMGVLPDYRTRKFKQRLGLSPSAELLRAVTSRFSAQGLDRAVLYVDRDNSRATRFYAEQGWKAERLVTAGWPVPQLEFCWNGRPEETREKRNTRLGRELASIHKLVGETPGDVGLG